MKKPVTQEEALASIRAKIERARLRGLDSLRAAENHAAALRARGINAAHEAIVEAKLRGAGVEELLDLEEALQELLQ
jgi:hypothetical protein